MNRKNLLVLGLIVLALAAAALTRQNTYADNTLNGDVVESNLINDAFIYQGRLNDNGQAANGTYDFQAYIFSAAEGGALLANHSNLGTAVANGLFQLEIQVDHNIFNSGGQRWLEIWVSPAGENEWITLTPRQEIQPVPQAVYAEYAGQLANPGETIIQVSPFDALQSDGHSALSFAARGTGRLEIWRTSQGNSFVYIPVDVPAQIFGNQQQLSLESMRFCYNGFNNGFGVVAGIVRATVRQINDMNTASNMLGEVYTPTLVGENECVTVEANAPVAVTGSMWVRFEVEASDMIALELGEISLTFTTDN